MADPSDAPLQFQLRKLGHVVLNVTDIERSVRFYTEVLGLAISDRYPDSMVPGGMVFMRCNADHHGVALVGGARQSDPSSLNHFAFEVATLDEVFRARAWLRKHSVPIVFEDAGAPAVRSPWSSRTPTATTSRSTGASTRSARTATCGPRASGARRAHWRTRSPACRRVSDCLSTPREERRGSAAHCPA